MLFYPPTCVPFLRSAHSLGEAHYHLQFTPKYRRDELEELVDRWLTLENEVCWLRKERDNLLADLYRVGQVLPASSKENTDNDGMTRRSGKDDTALI